MQEQISKKPLVDILSQMSGKQVVMNGDDYVFLQNGITVSQAEIDEALVTQSALEQKSIQELYLKATDEHLNAKAKEYGYDDIKTAVTYADEPSVAKFQTEGQAFRTWRSLVYAYLYEQMELVQNETRTAPASIEELIAELPTIAL